MRSNTKILSWLALVVAFIAGSCGQKEESLTPKLSRFKIGPTPPPPGVPEPQPGAPGSRVTDTRPGSYFILSPLTADQTVPSGLGADNVFIARPGTDGKMSFRVAPPRDNIVVLPE